MILNDNSECESMSESVSNGPSSHAHNDEAHDTQYCDVDTLPSLDVTSIDHPHER